MTTSSFRLCDPATKLPFASMPPSVRPPPADPTARPDPPTHPNYKLNLRRHHHHPTPATHHHFIQQQCCQSYTSDHSRKLQTSNLPPPPPPPLNPRPPKPTSKPQTTASPTDLKSCQYEQTVAMAESADVSGVTTLINRHKHDTINSSSSSHELVAYIIIMHTNLTQCPHSPAATLSYPTPPRAALEGPPRESNPRLDPRTGAVVHWAFWVGGSEIYGDPRCVLMDL